MSNSATYALVEVLLFRGLGDWEPFVVGLRPLSRVRLWLYGLGDLFNSRPFLSLSRDLLLLFTDGVRDDDLLVVGDLAPEYEVDLGDLGWVGGIGFGSVVSPRALCA